ncbi:MAG: Hsp70 family protein, partial [Candidatus Hydrogenedens sp.]|nr:Hsp70 family protein [Candidatus Hydrogenedens sp.]
ASSDQPEALRALRHLIQRNYGYPVAREVEAAKKRLSSELETTIAIHHEDIHVDELLERAEFAHIIEDTLEAMMRSLRDAEAAAGVGPEDLDLVLTTGGTSLIPAIRDLLHGRYGAEKVRRRDTFTSVASGLAIVARHL